MEETTSKRFPWTLIPVLIALGISVFANSLLFGEAPQPTALRAIEGWGTGTHRATGCGSSSETFYALTHKNRIYFACSPSSPKDGGTLRVLTVDPQGPRLQQYTFPADSPLGTIESLIPNENGRFGIIYRTRDRRQFLMSAIGGSEGWQQQPSILPVSGRSRFLGAGWYRDRFEAVVVPSTPRHRDGAMTSPRIYTSVAKRKEAPRTVSVDQICAGLKHCIVRYAYRRPESTQWHFIIDGSSLKDRTLIWVSNEQGPPRPNPNKLAKQELARGAYDNARNGRLRWPDRVPISLGPDGTIEPPPLPGSRQWRFSKRRPTYQMENNQLTRRYRWESAEKRQATAQRIDDLWFVSEIRASEWGMSLSFSVMNDEGTTEGSAQAIVDTRACPHFEWGAWAATESDQFIYASAQGCYLQLDKSLTRTDPLTVLEQAQRQRRDSIEASGWLLPALVFWGAFGLPLLGLVGFVIRRREPLRTWAHASHAFLLLTLGLLLTCHFTGATLPF